MKVGVLVLAAGRSTRFGSDKRLATLANGQSVLATQLSQIRNSRLPYIVCLRSDDDLLAKRLRDEGNICIQCARADEGMGATLAEATTHLPDWEGVLVALADMPWIAADTYRLVAAQLSASRICLPVFKGLPGHPVGFGKDYYHEIRRLAGDIGAKRLLEKHPQYIHRIEITDVAIHCDIDRPSDLKVQRKT